MLPRLSFTFPYEWFLSRYFRVKNSFHLCLWCFTGPVHLLRTVASTFQFGPFSYYSIWSCLNDFDVWRFLFSWIVYVQGFHRKIYTAIGTYYQQRDMNLHLPWQLFSWIRRRTVHYYIKERKYLQDTNSPHIVQGIHVTETKTLNWNNNLSWHLSRQICCTHKTSHSIGFLSSWKKGESVQVLSHPIVVIDV